VINICDSIYLLDAKDLIDDDFLSDDDRQLSSTISFFSARRNFFPCPQKETERKERKKKNGRGRDE
jgi:hypothetical protein